MYHYLLKILQYPSNISIFKKAAASLRPRCTLRSPPFASWTGATPRALPLTPTGGAAAHGCGLPSAGSPPGGPPANSKAPTPPWLWLAFRCVRHPLAPHPALSFLSVSQPPPLLNAGMSGPGFCPETPTQRQAPKAALSHLTSAPPPPPQDSTANSGIFRFQRQPGLCQEAP